MFKQSRRTFCIGLTLALDGLQTVRKQTSGRLAAVSCCYQSGMSGAMSPTPRTVLYEMVALRPAFMAYDMESLVRKIKRGSTCKDLFAYVVCLCLLMLQACAHAACLC